LAPQHIPPASLVIWRAVLAGGVAGVVSRTMTAPLEKIKILAQAWTSLFLMALNVTLELLTDQYHWQTHCPAVHEGCVENRKIQRVVCW